MARRLSAPHRAWRFTNRFFTKQFARTQSERDESYYEPIIYMTGHVSRLIYLEFGTINMNKLMYGCIMYV